MRAWGSLLPVRRFVRRHSPAVSHRADPFAGSFRLSDNPGDRFTASDLLAVTLLHMRIPSRAAVPGHSCAGTGSLQWTTSAADQRACTGHLLLYRPQHYSHV